MNHAETHAAVMFADISGSSALYEKLGDAPAHTLIHNFISAIDLVVEKHGGCVVKHIGDEVLAVFKELDSAANCAIQIHRLTREKPPPFSLQIKIGIQHGPIFQTETDIFGDTVNTAARIVSMATAGQTLAGAEITTINLAQGTVRSIGSHSLKGKKQSVEVYELLDTNSKALTSCAEHSHDRQYTGRILRLNCLDSSIEVHQGQKVILGRDESCHLRVDHHTVSREHAAIEGIRNRFVLRDTSTNGLLILANDGNEYTLHREGITLVGSGAIYLGMQSACVGNTPVISFEITRK